MDPRRMLPLLAALAAACVVATATLSVLRADPVGTQRPDGAHARVSSTAQRPARSEAGTILASWDEHRAAAWAAGDVAALRALYASDSQAGRADARLLQRYVARGLRVTGLRTQLVSLRVLRRHGRRLCLVVTDRILAGEAVGQGRTVPLPADRASTRRIDLVRVGDTWVVEEVRDQASAAASTSRTSSSSKS